jgi:hypothetical protein
MECQEDPKAQRTGNNKDKKKSRNNMKERGFYTHHHNTKQGTKGDT